MLILIAYDGSENADHAIDVAGEIFPGATAEIIHVWEAVASAAARAAVYVPIYDDDATTVRFERDQASAVADRGVQRAAAAGLQATGEAVQAMGPLWAGIVDRIAERRPAVTVMGTRGLTGLRGALAGSVSHAVISHAHAPVLTVPMSRDAST